MTVLLAIYDVFICWVFALTVVAMISTFLFALLTFLPVCFGDKEFGDFPASTRLLFKRMAIVTGSMVVFSAVTPSTSDLWRTRVNLVKLELASPENVKAGAEAVGRIAVELECKYLANCGKKK